MSTPTRDQKRAAARAERQAEEERLARAGVRKKRLSVLGGVVAVAAVAAVLLIALSGSDDQATPRAGAGESVAGQTATAALLDGIPQNGRFLGSPDAPVTLVEFADPQCPFCAQFSRDVMPTLVREQVRTGRVRLESRPRTFLGPDSEKAARIATAAGTQDRQWNVLELLFANQGAENSGWVSDKLLSDVLRAAGVDAARARAGAATDTVTVALSDADLLATRNALDSTPSFLIGRTGGALRPLPVQALTPEAFTEAIDRLALGS